MLKAKFKPFSQAPYFKVKWLSGQKGRKPEIEIAASELDLICLRLAKAGYGGGIPQSIAYMDCDWVMKMIQYEDFCSDYEKAYLDLNKNG